MQLRVERYSPALICVLLAISGVARAQSTGATFGDVIRLTGTPSDVVLDEYRGRLYLVNSNANRVDVYDYNTKELLSPLPAGTQPLAAAMSMDGAWLYVTNNASATLSVIDLGLGQLTATVALPAKPEGVEVGFDGRAVISTQGTGTGNLTNTLLIYDRSSTTQGVTAVPFPPPPPTPTNLPPTQARPVTTFRGKLIRTPDGQFIVGVSTINNNTQTIAYVYEAASGTVLRSRTVTGQSTVLSMSPDGSRFMAGFTMYDTATLSVMAQQSISNSPFPMPAAFNVLQNNGGSSFAPDGATLYSAFNVAAFTQPPARPQSSILLISDTRHLGIRLGIKIPESIIARMVMASDGSQAWGLSESGLIHLQLDTLYDYPILQPETTQVFLASDDCNKGLVKSILRVNNLGKGKLTFSVPNTGSSLTTQVSSGVAPSSITFTMDPGRSGVIRQPGTNLSPNAGLNGVPVNVNLASSNAVNIPNTIRVYMNYRQADMRGQIFPVPVALDNTQGLLDNVLDEGRGLLYLANSGYNRIEVFDLKKQRLLTPIDVCQLPRQMAMTPDGSTMYVSCQGSELLTVVDLDQGVVLGRVEFPPIPRAGNANPVTPLSIAMGVHGLQFVASNGTLWKVVGNQAVPRDPSPVVGVTAAGAQTPVATPAAMVGSPDYRQILLLGGNGTAYLYDALADAYTNSRQLFTQPLISYYGPLGIAPDSSFMLANGLILNGSLTVIGGAERPGTTTVAPPTPGQPPTVTVVSAGLRNVAAVAPVNETAFVRLTTPVRNSINATTTDDIRTTLEAVDTQTGGQQLVGVGPENPVTSVFGTTLSRIPPRLMSIHSAGASAVAITLSGVSYIPLAQATTATRPAIPAGVRGIVNAGDGTTIIKPGSFIYVNGVNLASSANADQVPLPTVLGGSCVVFNDVAVPLIQAAPNQLSAQVPETLRPGIYVVQVRSLAMAQSSEPLVLTVQKP